MWTRLKPGLLRTLEDYHPFILVALFNSQNSLQLNIYFQELNYQLIQEIPAYDSESLLGK